MIRAKPWSPVEIDYLRDNETKPITQLAIALARCNGTVKKKIKELKDLANGVVPVVKTKGIKSKIGKRKDCNNLFFRSGWEANLWRFLARAENVLKVEYEPTDFTFWQFGIKKGTVSYTPDFKVYFTDGTWCWIEVKGYLKPSDKTRIRRFKKFFPEDAKHLVAVTAGATSKTAQFFTSVGIEIKWFYPDLNKMYKNLIPNWE